MGSLIGILVYRVGLSTEHLDLSSRDSLLSILAQSSSMEYIPSSFTIQTQAAWLGPGDPDGGDMAICEVHDICKDVLDRRDVSQNIGFLAALSSVADVSSKDHAD